MNLAVLYSTFSTAESAETAGRVLVEKGLVACVNLLPGATSIYRWEGAVHRETEVVLIAKTTVAAAPMAAALLKEKHPYQLPCITWWQLDGADAGYVRWVGDQVRFG